MRSCLTFCVMFLMAASSISSAQLVTRCADDAVAATDALGRNAWAANCGYVTPQARDFFDADGDYLVFTTGCSRVGCSPALPVTALAPCVSDLVKLGLCKNAFAVSVSSFESGVSVASPRGVELCPDSGTCQFAYVTGTPITMSLTSTRNVADCLQFSGWQGACAGQSSSCSLVVNSDVSARAVWSRISGCIPR